MPQSAQEVFLVAVEISGAAVLLREQDLWETIRVSEKRTKADKAQRQADQLEKKASRRPAPKKKPTREDFSQAALRRSGS
jgi:hypothetical protein